MKTNLKDISLIYYQISTTNIQIKFKWTIILLSFAIFVT